MICVIGCVVPAIFVSLLACLAVQLNFRISDHGRVVHVQWMAALATLAILRSFLGIDNVVFLGDPHRQAAGRASAEARTLGLLLAAVGRLRRFRDLVGDHARQDSVVRFAVPHAGLASGGGGGSNRATAKAAVTPVKADDPSAVDSPAVVEGAGRGRHADHREEICVDSGRRCSCSAKAPGDGHQLEPHRTEGGGRYIRRSARARCRSSPSTWSSRSTPC